MAKPYSWSYSKIDKFETCPHQFYRLYILGDIKDEGNYASSRGGMVHSSLEKYALADDREAWFDANEELVDDLGIAEYFPVLEKMLTLPASKIVCEEKIACDGKFNYLPDYFDWRVRGRAIADLTLEFKEMNHVVMVDYKTGKDYAPKFKRQGKVVAGMKMIKDPWVETINIRFHNMDTDNYGFTWTYTRDDLPELMALPRAHTNEVKHAIKDKVWTKRPNGLCSRFCPVKDCEHNGG